MAGQAAGWGRERKGGSEDWGVGGAEAVRSPSMALEGGGAAAEEATWEAETEVEAMGWPVEAAAAAWAVARVVERAVAPKAVVVMVRQTHPI